MLTTVSMLLVIAGLTFWRQKKWWASTTLASEGWASCLYIWYGDSILQYYKMFTSPLSCYFMGATLRRSISGGRLLYSCMLAFQAFCLFIAGSLLFDSPWTGFATGTLFLLYTFTPFTFTLDIEPEAYGFFFASLGIAITAVGTTMASPWICCAGVFIGSLAFHCKVTLFDGLSTLVIIAAVLGMGDIFWLGCITYAGSMALFCLLVVIANFTPHENDYRAFPDGGAFNRIKLLKKQVSGELTTCYRREPVWHFNSHLQKQLCNHAIIVAPMMLFTVAGIYQGLFTAEQRTLLFCLAAIPLIQCLIRMKYTPLYAFMIHFPLAMGTGRYLDTNAAAFLQHPITTLIAVAFTLYFILLHIKRYAIHETYRKRSDAIKKHILDPINPVLSPDDYVFQDSCLTFIYLELGCNCPYQFHIWADRIETSLSHQRDLEQFIDFFRTNRPKYYIAHQRKFNLSYLEHMTGLRYTLQSTAYAHVYKLTDVRPWPDEEPSHTQLFGNTKERYAIDQYEMMWRSTGQRLTLPNRQPE